MSDSSDMSTTLSTILKSCSFDTIFAVRRKCCADVMPLIIEIMGDDWSAEHLLPVLRCLGQSNNYLHRGHVLDCVHNLKIEVLSNSTMWMQEVTKFIEAASVDPVPNVRLRLATVAKRFCFDKENANASLGGLHTIAKFILGRLRSDSDADVRYFARLACGYASDEPAQSVLKLMLPATVQDAAPPVTDAPPQTNSAKNVSKCRPPATSFFSL
mmetsp:Transcript_2854/g.3224  ORF Transcript_2854/g.3224 Transcript_2854/m.3224 type:complete len:213 (-) Transcript_2854:2-640(-)